MACLVGWVVFDISSEIYVNLFIWFRSLVWKLQSNPILLTENESALIDEKDIISFIHCALNNPNRLVAFTVGVDARSLEFTWQHSE